MIEPFPPLKLGKEEFRPVVVRDTRERQPISFERLAYVDAGLVTGDYSYISGEQRFAIELKSICDLVSSLTIERARFERELARLAAMSFRRLLIIGSLEDITEHHYRSKASPKAILSSLAAFQVRYDLPFVFAATAENAAILIEDWIFWHARETLKSANELYKSSTVGTDESEEEKAVQNS